MERIKLVINRGLWHRGQGSRDSKLRRASDGKMCCLGFLGAAIGLTSEQMTDVSAPWSYARKEGHDDMDYIRQAAWPYKPPSWEYDLGVYGQLTEINDERISDAEREQKITGLMAALGIDVTFVDEDTVGNVRNP